ncbi:MAG TPA: HEAT repeat domain-containing protein, partial [Polyangiaceae bacterium]|nr:HEAT repeat domain-containing protein [Polyangiaceae bacterium]
PTSPALIELPFVLAEVPEPGVAKLLGRFLEHQHPEVVASAIEASVEFGDPALAKLIAPLRNDKRVVDLDDETGERDQTTLGQLAREACEVLEAAP